MNKKREEIVNILERYPGRQKSVLAILHEIQAQYGFISADHMKRIAKHTGISMAEVFSNITFYDAFSADKQGELVIQVCDGTVCHSKSSKGTLKAFEHYLGLKAGGTTADGKVTLKTVNCMGYCNKAPVVVSGDAVHGNIQVKDLPQTIEQFMNGNPDKNQEAGTIPVIDTEFENILLKKAANLEDYMQQGGFKGLEKALQYPKRRDIIAEVKLSGLRGRSGSSFLVGDKWMGAYNAPGRESNRTDKYIIANGDEGDPGAFMDRWLMEETPYAILEGLVIAGCAVNANKGFLYIRDEYRLAISRIQAAMEEMRQAGWLGREIMDTDFDFDCEIVHAARSYVCGEEGALMESVEGKPGIPRVKPPLPTIRGVLDQPTIINNAETLANVPLILRMGGTEYAKTGNSSCTGTKLISLVGNVKKKGLVEVPMGSITLRELIFHIGGGIEGNKKFKCIQTGGPSGGYITEKDLDLPLDFVEIQKSGSLLGSGGVIVLDETACAVDLAKYMVEFLADESCGTCTPCREGLRCMLHVLNKITDGHGEMEDLDLLEEISFAAAKASRCALGKSIGNPVMTTLKQFRSEYEEHIKERKCAAGRCKLLD